ncbi:MAG: ADP-ribosylation factor-like protein [Promethearchaeota archaeon]
MMINSIFLIKWSLDKEESDVIDEGVEDLISDKPLEPNIKLGALNNKYKHENLPNGLENKGHLGDIKLEKIIYYPENNQVINNEATLKRIIYVYQDLISDYLNSTPNGIKEGAGAKDDLILTDKDNLTGQKNKHKGDNVIRKGADIKDYKNNNTRSKTRVKKKTTNKKDKLDIQDLPKSSEQSESGDIDSIKSIKKNRGTIVGTLIELLDDEDLKDDIKLNNEPLKHGFYDNYFEQIKESKSKFLKVMNIYDYNVISLFIPADIIIFIVLSSDIEIKSEYSEYFIEEIKNTFLNELRNNDDRLNKLMVDTFLAMVYINIELYLREENNIIDIIHLIEDFENSNNPNIIMSKDSKRGLSEKTKEANSSELIKVFLYGLDNAGKSSWVRFLKTGKFDYNFFTPTKKKVIHNIKIDSRLKIILWEMPGQKSFRRVWLRGIQDSNIIVFMLDAADEERFAEAKREFWRILSRYELRGVPLLFIANKVDLVENKFKLSHIEEFFSLDEINDREWCIKFMSLATKEGCDEVIEWLKNTIKKHESING